MTITCELSGTRHWSSTQTSTTGRLGRPINKLPPIRFHVSTAMPIIRGAAVPRSTSGPLRHSPDTPTHPGTAHVSDLPDRTAPRPPRNPGGRLLTVGRERQVEVTDGHTLTVLK